jgi:predicted ester cyclase
MRPEQRRTRVLDLIDAVINAHDPVAISRFTAEPAIQGTVRSLLTAFPDLHFDVLWTVAEGDRVVAFVEMTGTHEGPWLMVQEPTHQMMSASLVLGLQIDDDGMVVDSWLGTNFIAMLAQVGWGVAPFGGTVPTPASR